MPLTATENLGAGAFIKSEHSDPIVFDEVTVVSGSGVVKAGTVLGRVTASGKFKPYDNDASDGSEVARVIALHTIDATSSDVKVAAVARLAEVWGDRLVWGAGVTTNGEKTAAIAGLATTFVIVR